MNTKFLLSPAYLCSAALLIVGAVLSGGRFMLIGWIFFIVGLFLNALVLVVLVNRLWIWMQKLCRRIFLMLQRSLRT